MLDETYKPTPQQVHSLIPVRPAFTATSAPSLDDVQAVIDLVAESVEAEAPVGGFPEAYRGKVKLTIAYNVAAQVEVSYWPEQQLGPESGTEQLYRSYTAELTGLRKLTGSAASSVGAAAPLHAVSVAGPSLDDLIRAPLA